MIRVPTTMALESWLGKRGERTADPTALEVELLTAACGSPLELAELPSRVGENELYESIKRGHRGTTEWGQGLWDGRTSVVLRLPVRRCGVARSTPDAIGQCL
jgi:hypothetical protein